MWDVCSLARLSPSTARWTRASAVSKYVHAEPVILIANGDLRLAANQKCWPAQARAEEAVMDAIRREGARCSRGHAYDPAKRHGFIDSQKRGMEVFREIPPDAPLVVVEAVWQYSHHLLHGLYTHRGPDSDRRELERRMAGPGRAC